MPPHGCSRQEQALHHARPLGTVENTTKVVVAEDAEVDTAGNLAPVGGSEGPALVETSRCVPVTAHVNSDGSSALVVACTGPQSRRSCVATVITDLAVVDVRGGIFVLRRTASGVSASDVVRATTGRINIMFFVRAMAPVRGGEGSARVGHQ